MAQATVLLAEQRNSMSTIRKIAILSVAVTSFLVTSCTPREIQVFNTLTPTQQKSVIDQEGRKIQKVQELSYEVNTSTESHDCYESIAKIWPVGMQAWARSIVWRESRNTPTAANPVSSARGCWQLLMSLHAKRFYAVGCTPAQWSNPDCNSKVAYSLYKIAGTSPWRL